MYNSTYNPTMHKNHNLQAVWFAAGMAVIIACLERAVVVSIFKHLHMWVFLALNLLLIAILFTSKYPLQDLKNPSQKCDLSQDSCEKPPSPAAKVVEDHRDAVVEDGVKGNEDMGFEEEDDEKTTTLLTNDELNERVEAFISRFRQEYLVSDVKNLKDMACQRFRFVRSYLHHRLIAFPLPFIVSIPERPELPLQQSLFQNLLKLHLVGLKCSTFHQSHQSKVGVAAVALQSYVGAVISVEHVVVRILLKGGIYFAFLLELLLPVRICIALSSARMKIVLLSSSPLNFAVGNHHSFAIHFGPTFLAIIPELVARALLNAATTTLFLFPYETIRGSSASEKKGGLGVSSYFALNRALLLKWVWRFVSQMILCWFVVIQAVHGDIDCVFIQFVRVSIWSSILKEVKLLKVIWNLISCRIALNDMMVAPLDTSFGDQLGRGRGLRSVFADGGRSISAFGQFRTPEGECGAAVGKNSQKVMSRQQKPQRHQKLFGTTFWQEETHRRQNSRRLAVVPPLLVHEGFAAVLAVLITGSSQCRQHGKSEPDLTSHLPRACLMLAQAGFPSSL
ncbi:hypothetical protein Tco_0683135 [Tanacetum coccineum]|uniref:Uncharacterized protein n=1 Tax=Tanacetum coccineum TaxID=301880 RepID=A0ABQ4XU80_9ASTR